MNSIQSIRRQSALDELHQSDWLAHAEWIEEIDSTNNCAKLWYAAQPSQTPALFVADRQTAGRGRSGNQWWSPTGCLMFTLAIPASELPADAARYPHLAFVVGVALAECVRKLIGHDNSALVQLKWPNDVYVDGRKLSGILIETLHSRPHPIGFAVGVGINAQIDWRTAPEGIAEKATCLSRVASRAVECEEVLLEFLPILQKHFAAWREHPECWLEPWRRMCLLTSTVVRVRTSNEAELVGICEGVDSAGQLLLRDEQQLHSITACEILGWHSTTD